MSPFNPTTERKEVLVPSKMRPPPSTLRRPMNRLAVPPVLPRRSCRGADGCRFLRRQQRIGARNRSEREEITARCDLRISVITQMNMSSP